MSKKGYPRKPVIEEHKFVPNETSLSLEDSIRVNMQIALEINQRNKIKVIEIADARETLLPSIINSLDGDPMVEIEAILLTEQEIKIPGVKVENSPLHCFQNVYMIIGNELFNAKETPALFILSREPLYTPCNHPNFKVLSIHNTPFERLVLTSTANVTPLYQTLEITNNFKWLQSLQDMLITDENEIILHTHHQDTGLLGFTKSLRREGKNIRCVITCDPKAPTDQQLQKRHTVNVFKDGKWGTYRSFHMKTQERTIGNEHCLIKDNLHGMEWIEGPLKTLEQQEEIVFVCKVNDFIVQLHQTL